MEYSYLDQGDKRLLELAQLPLDNGVAIAMRTTGYATQGDEILELAISDMEGKLLFAKRVKPQNIEEWSASDASGGLTPADVEQLPELYQFEDEIMEVFEKADFVICEHLSFAHALIEASWVALPDYQGFDLYEEFRQSHCAKDYPGEAASAVALSDIANYYGLVQPSAAGMASASGAGESAVDGAASATVIAEAALVAACYRKLVEEHVRERDAKGTAYWEEYERKLAEEASKNVNISAAARMREKRLNQMNGLLWISGAIIFTSLIIQLYQRGWDVGFMIIAGAVAVFCLIRGIANFRK